MLPWFKLFTNMRHDGKVWKMTPLQYRTFTFLLCYAAEQPTRGVIVSDDDEVLAHETTHGDVTLLHETLSVLEEMRCVTSVTRHVTRHAATVTEADGSVTPGVTRTVTERTITFVNFAKRQGGKTANGGEPSMTPEAIRARRSRENKRIRESGEASVTPRDNSVTSRATSHVTEGVTGGVTPSVTGSLDRDSDGDNTPHIPPPRTEDREPSSSKAKSKSRDVSQPTRTEADLADVRAAEEILRGDLRTESVAMALGREHNLPGCINVPGWKWLLAAKKLLEPGIADSARRNFKYYAKIAWNLTDADRKKLEAKAPPPPREPEYYVAKRRPAYKVITARDFEAKAG